MESQNNIILLNDVRRRRKIRKIKRWFMKPIVITSLFIFLIYGVLIGGYFITDKDNRTTSGLVNTKVDMQSLPPYDLNK